MTSQFHFSLQTLFYLAYSMVSFAQDAETIKPATQENVEYVGAVKELQSIWSKNQMEDITRAINDVLVEAKDVADALLRDQNAKALAQATLAYPYALLVDAGYRFTIEKVPHFRRMTEEELPREVRKWFIRKIEDPKHPNGKGMLLNVKELGMWASVFVNELSNEIVIALRGTELRPQFFKDFLRNAKTVAEHTLGNFPKHFMKAYEFASLLKKKYPEKTLVLTGSSLGGSLALFSGLALDAKVFSFNSLGLNKKEIDFILSKNPGALDKADENVTLVSITGDMVSDSSDLLPKSFVNSYFGTVLKIPFYDDSFTGYYASNHHTSEAIVKSLGAYLKTSLSKYRNVETAKELELDLQKLTEELASDEFLVLNQSAQKIKFLAFSCTYSSGFGISSTYCDKSMFNYPHKNFTSLEKIAVWPAQSDVPGFSIAVPDKPIARILDSSLGSQTVIRLPESERLSWPKDYFSKNHWTYVTALNESPDCMVGSGNTTTFLGTPYYSGKWPFTFKGGKHLGWLLNSGKDNPKILVISSLSPDPCSFEIKAY